MVSGPEPPTSVSGPLVPVIVHVTADAGVEVAAINIPARRPTQDNAVAVAREFLRI